MKRKLLWSALFVLLPQVGRGQSGIITLGFEGLKDTEPVLNYYNGGFGGGITNSFGAPIPGSESGPGPNYGITFAGGSLALTSELAGGQGHFINEPSPNNVLFFQAGGDVMNVAGGFTTGFSFYYTGGLPGSVTVWSGADGTGTQLATLSLPAVASNTPGTNDTWVPVGVSFTGVAGSVNFGGTADNIAFDNITLGSARPTGSTVPAPSSLTVLAVAALLGASANWQARRARSWRAK